VSEVQLPCTVNAIACITGLLVFLPGSAHMLGSAPQPCLLLLPMLLVSLVVGLLLLLLLLLCAPPGDQGCC
jgi:hypothetical protein